jgi:hypothetical protein
MTNRASLFALTALAALSALAIATTAASANGFRTPGWVIDPGHNTRLHPPGQVVENCNGDPRLGCAVHIQTGSPGQVVENCNVNPRLGCAVRIEPTPVRTVAPCHFHVRARMPVRVITEVAYEVVRVRPSFHVRCATSLYPRHHVWY